MDSRLIFCIALLLATVASHSYLTNPVSRGNQRQTQSGCRGPTCLGPCELPASSASANPTTIARGAVINVKWPRNNHPGGFVRIAWALTAQSDAAASFIQGTQQYSCFEKGDANCAPASDPNGGDIATATQTSCGVDITVPTWLTDGKWTMQWAWFGGGYSLADYFGCVDYQISGGPTGTKETPLFYGGDYANPTNTGVCKYFNTDLIGVCNSEPCSGNGQQVGPPRNIEVAVTTGSASSEGNEPIACTAHTDCPSGVCEVTGFCYDGSSSGLGAGGIAALVFAFLFIALVAGAVVFAFVNKSEWSNWKPFKGAATGKYGFKGSINPTNS